MEINKSKEINIYKSISRIMVMIPWLILCKSRFDCVMADFVQFGILSNIWLCQYRLVEWWVSLQSQDRLIRAIRQCEQRPLWQWEECKKAKFQLSSLELQKGWYCMQNTVYWLCVQVVHIRCFTYDD